jgi:roadblock/LC7 domain-containing protein
MGIIKRLLALDGAKRVCHFRDDGSLVVGCGRMGRDEKVRLARFSHGYRHVAQGNADQLAMFAGMRGRTPPLGWIVRGAAQRVCGIANLSWILDSTGSPLNEFLLEFREISHW